MLREQERKERDGGVQHHDGKYKYQPSIIEKKEKKEVAAEIRLLCVANITKTSLDSIPTTHPPAWLLWVLDKRRNMREHHCPPRWLQRWPIACHTACAAFVCAIGCVILVIDVVVVVIVVFPVCENALEPLFLLLCLAGALARVFIELGVQTHEQVRPWRMKREGG
jgi:hypothetical protein